MFKTWKRIEKRFRKMKVKEEEEKRKKAKKDAVDDQGKGDDGDKRKKDDGEDKGKKGDGDKRKRKDDDYIAGKNWKSRLERKWTESGDKSRLERKWTERGDKRCQWILWNTLKMKTKVMPRLTITTMMMLRKRLTITMLTRRFMTLLTMMTKREKKGRVLISKRRWGHYANGCSPVTHTELKKNYERID